MPSSLRAAAVALLAATPALASRAFTYTLPIDAPTNDRALLLTAQGLLNRATPTLWLYEPVFSTFPNATYWYPENYLAPVKNFSFTPVAGTDFCALAAATGLLAPGGAVRGVALYDDAALDATRWLAVTASALDTLLPVTRALHAALPCLAALPVVADFSSPAALGFATNVGAYEWGRTNLLPRCSRDKLYSAGVSFTDATESVYNGADPAIDIGLDGAVALKMFVFNLSPDTKKYAAHAAEFQVLVAALRGPTTVPSVYGWAEPEPDMTLATSLGGGAVMCDAAPNLSFWLNVAARQPTLPYHATAPVLERDALYVAFQTNEGDTPKFAAGLMGGAWIDSARGSVPMSWGVNPLVNEVAPGLLEFYANTASANDTFFAATAGAGYAYPSHMPRDAFRTYVARAARLTATLTPGWPRASWEIDIWDTNNVSAISEYAAAFGDGVGAFSMQPEGLAGTNTVLPGGLPLIITTKELWYPQQNSACDEDFYAHALARAASNITTRPAFVLIYGLVPHDSCNRTIFDNAHAVRALGALPDGSPVHVVGMQDMVALSRAAAAAAAVPTSDAAAAPAAISDAATSFSTR
jgi:hypothetical protein